MLDYIYNKMGIDRSSKNIIRRSISNGVKWGKGKNLIDGLKVYSANVRSLRNKFDELKVYIMENNFDIICLCEPWVNKSVFGDYGNMKFRGS